jgi:hypothetical protein
MLTWLIGLVLACGSGYLWSSYARDYYLTRTDYAKRSKLHHDLSLFSECGFYYSFYEQVAGANDTTQAMQLMLNDRLSEYPDTINAMVRRKGHGVLLFLFLINPPNSLDSIFILKLLLAFFIVL